MEIEKSSRRAPKAVWLSPRTPQNFKARRDPAQARFVSVQAGLSGRQRRRQQAAELETEHQDQDADVRKRGSLADKGGASSRREATTSSGQVDGVRRIPSPTTLLGDGCSDPFHSTPVLMTALYYD